MKIQCLLICVLAACAVTARAKPGADIPWTTYQAEDMKTSGTVLGPKYAPYLVETESSGQKCVQLTESTQYLEFTPKAHANAMVVRYSLPDAENGGGVDSSLILYKNGKLLRTIPVTSRYSWLYGKYPFANRPTEGKPRNFYNEARLSDLDIAKGDVLRFQKTNDEVAFCIVDLVDIRRHRAASRPAKELAFSEGFGAMGNGEADDTEAVKKCLAEATSHGKSAWVPPGTYKLTGDIVLQDGAAIQGAGMWHTTFAGDADLYSKPDHRVRFKVSGDHVRLADFAICGKLNYRNDSEQNDGIFGAHAQNSTISNVWIEHTKVGMWFYVCSNIVIQGCRMRDTLADGINLCVDTRNCTIENCTARGTGDDCFAIWPTASDQSFRQQAPSPGNNVFKHCTGELPFLANGGAIYGGANNRIEDCLFRDISPGCGILISSTFPVSDEAQKIDNNFSGTTVVRNCDLVTCGGYDHDWAWRAAFQICLDRRSISGLDISNINITDSFSDGFSIVAPGSRKGQGTLSNSRMDHVSVPNYGLGAESRHGLWVRDDAIGSITIMNSKFAEIMNSSTNFTILDH